MTLVIVVIFVIDLYDWNSAEDLGTIKEAIDCPRKDALTFLNFVTEQENLLAARAASADLVHSADLQERGTRGFWL